MTRQALQLHPTHQREGDRAPPYTPMPVRGPPTLRRAAPLFSPPRQWVFSLFFSSLTQPHLYPLRALHVLDIPRQNPPPRPGSLSHLQHLWSVAPTPPAKHFSQTHPLQYLIHPRLISLPPLKIIAAVENRSCWLNLHLFPDLPLFPLISHSFFLPLSQFDQVQLVNEWS